MPPIDNKEDIESPFRILARGLINFADDSVEIKNETYKVTDNIIKKGSKIIVNECESPIYRKIQDDIKSKIQETPAPITVALATIVPYILAKPKFLHLRPLSLAAIGFSTSMYYCCPQTVSLISKEAVEQYKKLRENIL